MPKLENETGYESRENHLNDNGPFTPFHKSLVQHHTTI